jgi:hypothetical protein
MLEMMPARQKPINGTMQTIPIRNSHVLWPGQKRHKAKRQSLRNPRADQHHDQGGNCEKEKRVDLKRFGNIALFQRLLQAPLSRLFGLVVLILLVSH